VRDFDNRPAGERRAAREHLEQDGAGREKVGPRADGLPHDLFGGHVSRRTHDGAHSRQILHRDLRRLRRRSRQTEVE
jgi:hypothetical protein